MFRREVKSVADVLQQLLREEGLEIPLQQKRLIDSWENGAVGDAPLAVNSRMDSIIYLFLAAPPANSVLRHICYCSGIFCMHINHSGTLPNIIRLFIGYIVSYIAHFVNCAHL